MAAHIATHRLLNNLINAFFICLRLGKGVGVIAVEPMQHVGSCVEQTPGLKLDGVAFADIVDVNANRKSSTAKAA
jgi:hypothetical protein